VSDLKQSIRSVPDFPKPGIDFKDITTLLQDGPTFQESIDVFVERYRDKGITAIVAAEARGFIFGGALAYALGIGFIPVRKKGKLPYKTIEATYDLEYGSDTIELHEDSLTAADRVVIFDDLLATGGTIGAVTGLVEQLGAQIHEIAFLIELTFLEGRAKLDRYPIYSVIQY
jgi:adenine phosphoribosyltransferase